MITKLPEVSGFNEGRPCSIGRNGHICTDEPSLSRGHAEIRLVNGGLRLRDLGSASGTYFFKASEPVVVDECYVRPDQYIVLGSKSHTIKALLPKVGI